MTTQPQPEALRQRLLDHAACHESDHWLMAEDEQRQWASDLHEAEALIGRLHAECEALRRENVKLHGWLKAESQAGGILQRKLDAMEAECEALHAHLTAMCDEFVRTYPIYYYAEPWGHKTNKALLAARAALAARAEKEAM